jgi:hypothetical protein
MPTSKLTQLNPLPSTYATNNTAKQLINFEVWFDKDLCILY